MTRYTTIATIIRRGNSSSHSALVKSMKPPNVFGIGRALRYRGNLTLDFYKKKKKKKKKQKVCTTAEVLFVTLK